MLNVRTLGRGYAWLDTGTMDSLFEAGEFVRTVQRAQGLPIAIVEEIAYENGWITRDQLMESAERYGKSPCCSKTGGLNGVSEGSGSGAFWGGFSALFSSVTDVSEGGCVSLSSACSA